MKIIYIYLREINTCSHKDLYTFSSIYSQKMETTQVSINDERKNENVIYSARKMNEHQYMLQCGWGLKTF